MCEMFARVYVHKLHNFPIRIIILVGNYKSSNKIFFFENSLKCSLIYFDRQKPKFRNIVYILYRNIHTRITQSKTVNINGIKWVSIYTQLYIVYTRNFTMYIVRILPNLKDGIYSKNKLPVYIYNIHSVPLLDPHIYSTV